MNNYEKQCEDWRQRFLAMDQGDICRRLPEVEMGEDCLRLWHYGRRFGVDRREGGISAVSDSGPVEIMPRLNIYTLFHYASPSARLTGEWVPFRELRDGAPFAAAFQRGVLAPLAATFSGQEDRLAQAAEALRGTRLTSSAYLLLAFACLPVKLLFWEGDGEFPAQANLLFDRSATDFIHIESIVTVATELLYQAAGAAGLPVRGHAFYRF